MVDPARMKIPAAILDEASYWVAKMEGHGLSPSDQTRFDAWLNTDSRHAQAYAEMQDIWLHFGALPESAALRDSRPQPRAGRRRFARWRTAETGPRRNQRKRIAASTVAACSALICLGVVQDWPTRWQADAITTTGETRIVALSDGSRIQLGTNSAVAYDYDAHSRGVRLLKGEAVFTVAADASRPFRVDAGGGSTTALGTQFLVRRDGGATRIVVTEHKVQVRTNRAGGPAPIVQEGQAIRYGPDGIGAVTNLRADDAIAWTDNMLVFKDRPLDEVVSEIGRYHKGYLRVSGPARTLRVSGVFRIDDPDAAIEQLRRSLRLRVTSYAGWVITIAR